MNVLAAAAAAAVVLVREGGSMCRRRAPVAAHARTRGDEEGPREPVCRHWKITMDKINTFTLPSCAASFTCSTFTCRPPLPLGLQGLLTRR